MEHPDANPTADRLERADRWQNRLVIGFGLVITAAFVVIAWRFVRHESERSFSTAAGEAVDVIARDVGALDATVRGFQTLLHSVERVDGDQFRSFSNDVLDRYPFVIGASFSPRVVHRERDEFVKQHRDAGIVAVLDGLRIEGGQRHPLRAAVRDEYYPLLYKDLTTEDRTIFGLDVAHQPGHADLIAEAIASGAPTLGSPQRNIDGGRSLPLAIATYAGKRVPAQSADRRETADGVIVLEVDVDRLLTHAVGEPRVEATRLRGAEAIAAMNALPPTNTAALVRRAHRDTWQGTIELQPNGRPGQPLISLTSGAKAPALELGQLQFVRSLPLADAQLQVELVRRLSLRSVGWPVLLFGLFNGLGLALLAHRVVRSAVVTRRMNVLLSAKHREIHTINAGLEQTIADRTAALRTANAEVTEMLENLDDAVFMLGPDGTLLERYSPATQSILGLTEPANIPFDDILGPNFDAGDPTFATHRVALSLVFGGDELQWDLSAPDLIGSLHYAHPHLAANAPKRSLAIKYAPLFDAAARVERVLVVVSDLTEMLSLRREAAQRQDDHQLTADILLELVPLREDDRERVLEDATGELAAAQANLAVDPRLIDRYTRTATLRGLHTVKGNARMFGLTRLAKQVHALEDALARDQPDESPALVEQTVALAQRYRATSDRYLTQRPTVADSTGEVVAFAARLAAPDIGARLPGHARTLGRLAASLERDDLVDVAALLAKYQPMLNELSERLGKPLAPLEISGPTRNVYLEGRYQRALTLALTHGLRNAIDHGIEPPHERERRHKPAIARIWLELECGPHATCIRLCDDGAGLDVHAVADAADRDGDPFELVFQSGLTTKRDATELSGRGVGLDAVRAGLEEIGARSELRPRPGGGTVLSIELPLDAAIAWSNDGWLESSRPLVTPSRAA
ncbi:MAG: hypothetical protein B7733_25280 [Myxococcales bacterium FL481]|nr:MAG: hypothetical protein B7733_25280 [Myxococcales bacterium FL481]